jgi:broad specificity phosphatase PhoE
MPDEARPLSDRGPSAAGRTIWFVRHGESVSNAGGVSLPHHDIPLTAKGAAQALSVAALLPVPARVLVSGLRRTHDTAAPFLARLAASAETQALLDEFNMLSYALIREMDGTGRRGLSEAYWADPCPARRHGDGADTFAEFAARVDGFLREMQGLPDATVIFGHGTWLSLLCWRIGGGAAATVADMKAFRDFNTRQPVRNAEIVKMVCDGAGGYRVCRG